MFHGHGRGQDEVFQLRQKMFVTSLTRLGGAFKYFSMFTPITVDMIQSYSNQLVSWVIALFMELTTYLEGLYIHLLASY